MTEYRTWRLSAVAAFALALVAFSAQAADRNAVVPVPSMHDLQARQRYSFSGGGRDPMLAPFIYAVGPEEEPLPPQPEGPPPETSFRPVMPPVQKQQDVADFSEPAAPPPPRMPQPELDANMIARDFAALHIRVDGIFGLPGDRKALINGQIRTAGETLPGDAHLDSVEPDGVVFTYQGLVFRVPFGN